MRLLKTKKNAIGGRLVEKIRLLDVDYSNGAKQKNKGGLEPRIACKKNRINPQSKLE